MRQATILSFCILLFLTACQTPSEKYPVGRDRDVLTVHYGDDLPMTIYLPGSAYLPAPVVVFNHGRKFRDVSSGVYWLSRYHPFVAGMVDEGFAVAVPVRSGHYSAPGLVGERIACDSPSFSHFKWALQSGRKDVLKALDRLQQLPEIDASIIYVAGVSAGGFITLGSLDAYPDSVKAVVSFNGGRCGKRGDLFNGISYAEKLIAAAASDSDVPVLMVVSTNDLVIPPPSSYRLKDTICAARGRKCDATVSVVLAEGAGHQIGGTARSSIDKVVNYLKKFRSPR